MHKKRQSLLTLLLLTVVASGSLAAGATISYNNAAAYNAAVSGLQSHTVDFTNVAFDDQNMSGYTEDGATSSGTGNYLYGRLGSGGFIYRPPNPGSIRVTLPVGAIGWPFSGPRDAPFHWQKRCESRRWGAKYRGNGEERSGDIRLSAAGHGTTPGRVPVQMKKTRRPVVLTVNGKAELVVQDAESYQQILDRLDRLEAVAAIKVGIAAAEEGRSKPARKALAVLQEKLGISG